MPAQYEYRALTDSGLTQTGIVAAVNDQQVLDYLSEQRLTPISIKPAKKRRTLSLWGFFKGTQYENLIIFTNNLNTLYRAGIPMLRALSILRIGPREGRFDIAISQIRLSLQSGKPLSEAMAEFDDLFPRFYIASVVAGEESGKLDDVFDQLSLILEKELELTRQIKSGIRYPLIVISTLAAAFVVLMTYVVPKFIDFYGSFDAELPIFTRTLIATSNFFTHYWIGILAVIIAGALGFRKIASYERVALRIDRLWLRLPIVGSLVIKGNVARFAMMFSILLRSGLPIIKALDILIDSIKNSAIALEIRKIQELLQEGKEGHLLSGGFAFMPAMALQMLVIGLESGSQEKMLAEVGQHYSKQVQYASRHLTAIIEPILTLVLGVFVLMLALSIFLPMWNLIKVFSGP